MIKVYTWPNCPNCEALKKWLTEQLQLFETVPLTTQIQTDFIMRDIFGSTPILETSHGVLVGEEMFDGHTLNEELIRKYF